MNTPTVKEESPDFNQDMNNPDLHFKAYGNPDSDVTVIWAHGWGQSHNAFEALIKPIQNTAHHIAIDFPGFGQTPEPPEPWGSVEYTKHMADFLRDRENSDQPVIWIGHSFGCRVGVQMASRYPKLIKGMVLISAAGLKRKRSALNALWIKIRIATFKACKVFIPLTKLFGFDEEKLRGLFGSTDYKNASGVIRNSLIKVVNEDLSRHAQDVKCPVHLVFGENDDATPPEMGERYQSLILNAELTILPNQDHYTVLESGRHQVAPIIKNFIQKVQYS